MKFISTELAGAMSVELEPFHDERGFFSRGWCQREFEQHGLSTRVCQVNVSWNLKRGTLRGMHYQVPPYAESKLIRCVRGALYDVIIDLRRDSPTFGKWIGVELSADNRRMLYVPEQFAHGFITLADETEATYQVSEFYTPGAERGIRYNDLRFAIRWPIEPVVISRKDQNWPDYDL
jgi:dTDP-4-dehydrorhamnose 3,5-epimerase